eukprot:UN05840
MLLKTLLSLPDIARKDIVGRALPIIVQHIKQHIKSDNIMEKVACANIIMACIPFLKPVSKSSSAKPPPFNGRGPPPPPGRSDGDIRPASKILDSFGELLLSLFGIFEEVVALGSDLRKDDMATKVLASDISN